SEGRLQCFSKHAGNRPEVGRTLSHQGPFLGHYVCNIAADQLTKLNLGLCRKASDENLDASQRARLAIDFRLSLFAVFPDLGGGEHNVKAEDDTQRWQQPRRESLKLTAELAHDN